MQSLDLSYNVINVLGIYIVAMEALSSLKDTFLKISNIGSCSFFCFVSVIVQLCLEGLQNGVQKKL